MGEKKSRLRNACPTCGADLVEIHHRDNHGAEEHLETHCNRCRYCVGAEGELRHPGTKPQVEGDIPMMTSTGKER